MTKQEAVSIILQGCTNSNAPTINVLREMLRSAGCDQLVPKDAAEFVEVNREALLAAVQPEKSKPNTKVDD